MKGSGFFATSALIIISWIDGGGDAITVPPAPALDPCANPAQPDPRHAGHEVVPNTCCDKHLLDVLFIVQSSNSIDYNSEWKPLRNFLANFVKKYKVGKEAFRFGLMQYASKAKLEFKIYKHKDADSLKHDFMGMERFAAAESGTLNTGGAIREARDNIFWKRRRPRWFQVGGGGGKGWHSGEWTSEEWDRWDKSSEERSSEKWNPFEIFETIFDGEEKRRRKPKRPVANAFVLITEGASNAGPDVKHEAEIVRGKKVTMITIGVGDQVNPTELRDIATPAEGNANMLSTSKYGLLETEVAPRLHAALCKAAADVPEDKGGNGGDGDGEIVEQVIGFAMMAVGAVAAVAIAALVGSFAFGLF